MLDRVFVGLDHPARDGIAHLLAGVVQIDHRAATPGHLADAKHAAAVAGETEAAQTGGERRGPAVGIEARRARNAEIAERVVFGSAGVHVLGDEGGVLVSESVFSTTVFTSEFSIANVLVLINRLD